VGRVVSSYGIANVIVLPLTAWLGDRFGKKRYFVFSLIGFTLASVLCGMATSLPMLIVAQTERHSPYQRTRANTPACACGFGLLADAAATNSNRSFSAWVPLMRCPKLQPPPADALSGRSCPGSARERPEVRFGGIP
jgi:MFS family permease